MWNKNKQRQSQDVLNMLKVYESTTFKENMIYLTPIFTQLKESEVPKPTDPVEIEIKDDNRKSVILSASSRRWCSRKI